MLAAIKVSVFGNGTTTDKNGKVAKWLSPVAGLIPNKAMTISGSVAEREKLELDEVYLVQIKEEESSPIYGRQFSVTRMGKPLDAMQIINAIEKLGEGKVFDASAPAENSAYTEAKKLAPIVGEDNNPFGG